MGVSVEWMRGCAGSMAGTARLASFAGCGGASSSTETPPPATTLSPLAAVGELLLHDRALSVSGQRSCATCHDKAHAFAAADGASVPLGGPAMNLPGLRNAPSLAYASFTPGFDVIDGTPRGGFCGDSRASSLALQAQCTDLAAASASRSATVCAP